MTYEHLLLVSILLYLIQIVMFMYGVAHPRDKKSNSTQPFISVIIAARNEQANIAQCLDSVLQQTYPKERFEVIVANDGSTDETGAICKKYMALHSNVSVFDVAEDPKLKGKTNALAQAIDRSKGEILLITDADCVVPETWIWGTAMRYEPGVGIVGGMTLQRAEDGFSGMQSLDWAYLLGIAAAGVSYRNPLSTIGNNLSFRRRAYDDVGGYRKIPFSITEDYSLFQAIVRTRKWEYLYPIDPDILVTSQPCRTLRELYLQKKRWGKGGIDMKVSGFFIMAIGFLTHLLIFASLYYGAFTGGGEALLAKVVADCFLLNRVLKILKRQSDLRHFFFFELYYFFYVLLLPFVVFLGGKVEWKGRKY